MRTTQQQRNRGLNVIKIILVYKNFSSDFLGLKTVNFETKMGRFQAISDQAL